MITGYITGKALLHLERGYTRNYFYCRVSPQTVNSSNGPTDKESLKWFVSEDLATCACSEPPQPAHKMGQADTMTIKLNYRLIYSYDEMNGDYDVNVEYTNMRVLRRKKAKK